MYANIAFSLLILLTINRPLLAADSSPRKTLVYVDGAAVTLDSVGVSVRNKLSRLAAEEYWVERRAANQYVDNLLLESTAAQRGISVDELICLEVDDKVASPSAADIGAEINAADGAGPAAQRRAADRLLRARRKDRLIDYLHELRSQHDVRATLEAPRLATPCPECPSRGPANARVRIDEYSDFQCPYCSRMATVLGQVDEIWPDQIRVVFHDFPLSMHPDAIEAALAGRCAHRQGKFWPMHDAMFANQKNGLSPQGLHARAREAGLDVEAFDRCMSASSPTDVSPAREAGIALDIAGTPTLFINGIRASTASLEEIDELIDDELQRQTPGPLD